ncbi:hypothetical protein ACGF0D_10825 [Kitasatospora sp. NPDC048298]|uniref:hypothetical protein n=1 Tax=Kitasatospora sp. NPDC048298 TaxID=3364049 RepID=UPI0037149EBB
MPVTVTPNDLRNLLDSGAEDPVLYVNFDVDEEPELDVWAGAYVDNDHVVITRAALEDWLGDDWTDDDITEYLPKLQETADGIAPAPAPHFTAWLVNDRSCLDGDDCDIAVLADQVAGWKKGKPDWSSTGNPLFHALTGITASDGDDEEAIDRAEELLAEAGWSTDGFWEAVDTGYVVTVERADPDETWTIDEVTTHIGAGSTGSARKTLSRLGVEAASRAPGRAGQSIYSTAEVMYAHATRPGRGARTDLHDAE